MNDLAIQCPACSSAATLCFAAADHNRQIDNSTFDYWRCTICEMVFVDPVPNNLASYYSGGYQRIPNNLAELDKLADKERYRLKPILRHKQCGDLLEIGPWIGIFSRNAQKVGFDVDVIEMDGAACRFLEDTVGIHVTQSNDAAAALAAVDKTYDVIVFWHSLEHLPNAWKVLKEAARHLKPDGILLVAIPNIDSVEARFTKAKWHHLDAPRHLYFWGPAALTKLCKSFGLENLHTTTHDRLSYEIDRNGWHDFIISSFGRSVPTRAIAKLGAPLITAGAFVLGGQDSGAGLTAVFARSANSSIV